MKFFSYKYKFYDDVDNHIKNSKIFSPLSQFKYNGFEFVNPERTTVFRAVIDGERKKIKYSLKWDEKTLILMLIGVILMLYLYLNKFYT